MALRYTNRYTNRTISYQFLQQGLSISEDRTTIWMYLIFGTFVWALFLYLFKSFGPALQLLLATLVAVVLTVGVLGYGVLRLKSVQATVHKRAVVPWDAVEKAEMKKNKVMLTLKEGTYSTGRGHLNPMLFEVHDYIELHIEKGREREVEDFLGNILADRFSILPS